MTRTCTKCGGTKPLLEFPRSSKGRDGHRERCRPCHNEDNRAYKERNREKVVASRKDYKQRNKERLAVARKAHYEKTKERVLKQSREWYTANKDRRNAASKKWVEANRARASYNARRYQLRRTKAVPPWADEERTAAIYAEARALRDLGVDAEVDHIIPLRGKYVSGLHWHGNLRIVLSEDNKRKSNRLPEGEDLACP